MPSTHHATKMENDWFVDHNVLSQIACADTISWMKMQVGLGGELYYDRWLFLEQGLNAGTGF